MTKLLWPVLILFVLCSCQMDDPGDADNGSSDYYTWDKTWLSLRVENLTPDNMTLTWDKIENPDPVQYYLYSSDQDNIGDLNQIESNGLLITGPISSNRYSITDFELSENAYYNVVAELLNGQKGEYNSYSYIPPVMKNLSMDFAPYNSETKYAGAFFFQLKILGADDLKVFGDFGYQSGGKHLVTMPCYHVARNASIYSPLNGIVTKVEYQTNYSFDYEIWISPTTDSKWTIVLDHVRDIQVSEGDMVIAGDIIGFPGYQLDDQYGLDESPWVFEMGIRGPSNNLWCPFLFFDPVLKTTYLNKMLQLMDDWEAANNDDTIYDQIRIRDNDGCFLPYFETEE